MDPKDIRDIFKEDVSKVLGEDRAEAMLTEVEDIMVSAAMCNLKDSIKLYADLVLKINNYIIEATLNIASGEIDKGAKMSDGATRLAGALLPSTLDTMINVLIGQCNCKSIPVGYSPN